MKPMNRMKKLISTTMTALLIMSSVPLYSGNVHALTSLPYTENFEGGSWNSGNVLTSLGTSGSTGTATTNSITVNNFKFTSTILDTLVSATPVSDLNAEVVAINNSKRLHLYDNVNSTKGNIDALTTFTPQTVGSGGATVNLEYDFMTNTLSGGSNSGARFRLANSANNSRPISIETTGTNKLQYRNASNTNTDFSPPLIFSTGTWYSMKIEINLSNSTYNVTVTNHSTSETYKATSVGFITGQPVTDIGGLDINTGDGAKMELFLDNLKVYNPFTAPAGVAATSGNAQVNLTWNTVTGATYYNVKRSQIATGPYTTIASNVTSIPYIDTNVTNGTAYYYVVSAADAISEGANSSEVTATPMTSLTLAAPLGLTATAGNASVALAWNSVNGATSYKVKRSSTSGGPYTDLTTLTGTTYSYSDLSANNGTTYYYVVSAVNSTMESANSAQAAATPSVPTFPAVPSSLLVSAGDTQLNLTWSVASGAASYNVKRSATTGGPYTTIATNVTGTSFNNTGLTNGVTYYYVISAVNLIGEGADSIEVSGKPGAFLINDDFENSTLGDVPNGYITIANAADVNINNVTVINNNHLTNKYYSPTEVSPANNKSAVIPGNSSNVLWINDNANASRRGGFTNTFTAISGKKGVTAQLDFMEPTLIGDSYPLELLDSSGKTVLSFSITNLTSLLSLTKGVWYNLKFVTDTGANSADVYMNGIYKGNYKFTTQDTNISKIQSRTAGSSTGSLYLDNVKVYQQEVVTPQNLIASGGNHIAELNWNAASGVDAYQVYRSTSSGGTYILVASNVPSNSYTDTGLTNDIPYYYKVTAVSGSGVSEYSNETFATPNNVLPPAAPTGLSAVTRDSQITLNWNSSDNATHYSLQRGTTPNGPFTQLMLNGSQKLTSTTYLDTNLTDGTPYYYQVAAGNIGGLSPYSGLPVEDPVASPAAPLGTSALLNAIPANNKVDLNWSSVTQATYYNVKRSTVNGGPYTTIAANVNGTSYSDAAAANSMTYYYVVTAANTSQESMISNQLKAVPYSPVSGAPNKPTGFKADANDGNVSLSWNPDSGSGVTSYNVKRGTVSGGPYTTLTTLASTSPASYQDSGVINGTTYYYVVSAVNANGESQNTDEIIVIPAKVLTVDKTYNQTTAGYGTNNFNTIQSAVNTIPTNNTARTVIYIKAGTYKEKLVINRPYISLVGEGMDNTTVVYGDYAGTSVTTGQPGHTGSTFLSQTVDVTADYFTASNLTIANSSAPRSAVAQAVALSLKSDKASFESVKLVGYQDTLYTGLNSANKGRHYFHNSIIQGDVDFIFGEAPAVVFDNVKMVLVSNSGGGGHITAGAQKNPTDMGYVFLNSQIIDDSSALGTYDLGRPWKDHAKIRFINTLIDSKKFLASGWIAACAGTCLSYSFAEYNSYGSGANPSARQIATQMTGSEASLTIPQLFTDPTNAVVADRTWDPSIPVMMPKVTYVPTLSVTSSSFDKNLVRQADIHVTVQNNVYALKNIMNGTEALSSSDYTVSGNVITLKKAYLAGLPEGTTTLSFGFDTSKVPLTAHLSISVINSDKADIGKQILAVNDGWASFTTGTTGGSTADSAHIFTVTNRSELIQALGGNNSTNATNASPKIIYVKGTIDMNVDDNNNPVGFDYYKAPGYDFNAYLAAYDPAVWGKAVPSGALETARAASETNQGNKIKINIGANTTIVGLPGSNGKIVGGNLMIQKVDNVIIRNIEFQNAFDYFPQWDPTDGDSGNWNSAFDNITVKEATHIWIDHNTFNDGNNPDNYGNQYFGRQYQQHDGLLDITNISDLVTVSYNYFHDHDKTTLVGGSDGYAGDVGKERITFHHNYYKNITQRAPRVRYGQVHLYNNLYEGTMNNPSYPFLYTIGVGYASQIYAQNNYFIEDAGTPASGLIGVFTGGTTFTDTGSVLNGAEVNIAQSKGGLSPVRWTPTLFTTMDPTTDVPRMVMTKAGSENTLPQLPQQLPAPSGVTASTGDAVVKVTWSSVAAATSYNVKRSTTSGGLYTTVAANVTSPQSYTDINVTNGTTYYYVVTAVNAAGESVNSSEVNATPAATLTLPEAPSGVVATTGNARVSLSWNAVNGVTEYNVKRSTTSGGPYTTVAANVTTTNYTDTLLTNFATYYYVVTAVNGNRESMNSAEISARPFNSSTSTNNTGTSGGSTGGTSSTGSQANSTDQNGVTLANVDPIKEQSADGKITLKVNVDAAALQQSLDELKAANGAIEQKIIINVKGSDAQVKVLLPLDMMVKAQTNLPATVLSVKFDNMTYDLPIKALDVAALSKELGADAKDTKISITIEKMNNDTAKAFEKTVNQLGLKLLTAVVDFNVTVEANGKIVSVHDFGQTYVLRTLTLAQAVDVNTTTALLYNPVSNEISFVPATFQLVDGVMQVTIKRPGNSLYAVAQSSKSFADLNGHWAKSDIELLASKLVVKGATDTSFAPQNQITRAEFAALLVRGLGLNEVSSAKFADVNAADWYAGAVGAASKAGLVEGFDEKTFKPGSNITREQMAVMISRAITISGKKAAVDGKGTTIFSDSASISTWAKDAVAQSYNAGIINGMTDKTFVPGANASRAEAAVMLKRLLQHVEFIN